ncbi:hypothetical protein [Petrachloros mirabilis]
MKMLFLTFRDSLQDEILAFLKNQKIHAYTYVPKVHGAGETGDAFGSFLTHGENALVMMALPDEQARVAIEAFRLLRDVLSTRQQGAAIPAKLMVLPCEEIV